MPAVHHPRVLMRADATAAIGWGHVRRCLSLAQSLRAAGADVRFTGHADGATICLLTAEGFAWLPLPASQAGADEAADAHATLAVLRQWPAVAVVVDHYHLAAPWHAAVRGGSGAAIVVIDDLADRPLAPDLLIDHNPAADHATKYRRVLPAGVPLCAGPRHALLDPLYAARAAAARIHPAPSSAVRRLGLFMGGTDPQAHTAWALQVLRRTVAWHGEVLVASTTANPRWRELQALVRADGRAELLLDLPHLADFHAACDLQIGAGGGALWERCCLGVPTLALIVADNQRLSVPLLHDGGVLVGVDALGQRADQARALASALAALLGSAGQRAELRRRSLTLVDGQGAQRTAAALLALLRDRHPLQDASTPVDFV